MTDEHNTTTTNTTPLAEPVHILPDTNLFLQARALQELPWEELAPTRDIVIIVPRTVQKELLKHKSDGNSRRAKRARNASALLLKAATTPTAPDHTTTIREQHPRVTLQLPTPTKLLAPPDDLDPNNPDDRILLEILTFRTNNPDKEALLLTCDTDQIVSAIHHHVPYHVIPEHWLLQPENDERDKRITELERELNTLKKTEPSITITNHNQNDQPTETITIERDHYDPLPEATIEELLKEAQQRHPPTQDLQKLVGQQQPTDPYNRTLLAVNMFQRYKPPTMQEVTDYYERDYPKWVNNLRQHLTRIHEQLNNPSRYTITTIILENNGTRPAEGVILTITIHAGLQLTRKAPTNDVTIPQPPRPPKGEHVNVGPGAGIQDMINKLEGTRLHDPFLTTPTAPPHHNPNTFYRAYGDQPTSEWKLTCNEFRHGDTERRTIGIIIPKHWQETNAAITITMTARNMSKPANKTITVIVNTTPRDTQSAARNLLNEQLKTRPTITIRQQENDKTT